MTLAAAVSIALWALAAVLPGVDVLRKDGAQFLKGKRIGLITNHTGRAIDGTSTLQVLRGELGLDVRALFSPEHGLSGREAAGRRVSSGKDAASELPVFSIYGETRKPTPDMLRGVDALVFDIQDIGVRFYTYISTLKLSMEAAAEANLDFVVLDRPNPRGGVVEGPVLDSRYLSFVGIAPIALVHGMTVGELARYFQGEGLVRPGRARVVEVQGWRRSMTWEETGLPFRPTSPNIRTAASAVAYGALGLFEGVNVSEGRGTRETFLIAGAPWINREKLVSELESLALPAVRFVPETFTPQVLPEAPEPLYPGEPCAGFRVEVASPGGFEAVRTGLSAIAGIRRLYPAHFQWKQAQSRFVIDRLLGTDEPRRRIEAGDTIDAIMLSFEPALVRFRERRAKYLIYGG